MKLPVLPRLLALVLACAAPVWAGAGHNHGHEAAAKITGPNKGELRKSPTP